MRRAILITALTLFSASFGSAETRQLAVIVNPANTTSDLTSEELKQIFSAKTSTWPTGTSIQPVIRNVFSSEMKLFLRVIMSMTPEQEQQWLDVHKGKFAVADSDQAVIQFVSSTRGAIGMVDLYSIKSDVKVVRIGGKLPVEAGYVLKGNQ